MNDTSLNAVRTEERSESRRLVRSPVLNQMRLNPFHVLRLPIDASVDEAIWKAEEALTLQRAGMSLAEPDVLPWLPAPDEQEIRQAVQWVEEPLRRALEQVCWFDFKADPAGDLLQQALASLDADGLTRYMASEEAAETVVRANHANLRLLLGALALADALPESWPDTDAADPLTLPSPPSEGGEGRVRGAPAPWAPQWKKAHGVQAIWNPHEADLTESRRRLQTAKSLWRDALGRWAELLQSPAYLEHVKSCLARLGDEFIGEDDAEALINSLLTRLTDLVAGEIKVQVLAGRLDRVRMLLDVAASCGIETRRWVLALRPLRPLFQAEVAELDVLLGDPSSPRLDDVELYLRRLWALTERWTSLDGGLDPTGLLGLAEFTDAAVAKVNNLFGSHLDYGAAPRITHLLEGAAQTARAGSIKQRLSASVNRLTSQERWLCHFCSEREADVKCSAVVSGKKETHRTYGFNSTTIHYAIKKDIVQRCPRCADLHAFLRSVGVWTWVTLLPFYLLFFYYNAPALFGRNFNIFLMAGIVGSYIVSGYVARRVAAEVLTPWRERRYSDVSSARQYQGLKREGYGITLDFSRNAYQKAVAETGG